MEEVSNPLDLLSTNMCSPIVVFIIIAILSIISLYISRGTLKRYNNNKMENLYNLHALHEIKLLIFMGVILYGLCQYNQVNLAWIFLLFPVIYLILKNSFIFVFVSLAQQNAPIEIKAPNYPMSQQGQKSMLQETQKQQQVLQQNNSNMTSMPVNKTINMIDGFNAPLGI
tara:strand:- start:4 stop:513 length:510 start_codon:yes stop_codon:yes gene_type:complete